MDLNSTQLTTTSCELLAITHNTYTESIFYDDSNTLITIDSVCKGGQNLFVMVAASPTSICVSLRINDF